MRLPLILITALAAGCGMLGIGGGPSATANLQPTDNAGARVACAVIQAS